MTGTQTRFTIRELIDLIEKKEETKVFSIIAIEFGEDPYITYFAEDNTLYAVTIKELVHEGKLIREVLQYEYMLSCGHTVRAWRRDDSLGTLIGIFHHTYELDENIAESYKKTRLFKGRIPDCVFHDCGTMINTYYQSI